MGNYTSSKYRPSLWGISGKGKLQRSRRQNQAFERYNDQGVGRMEGE